MSTRPVIVSGCGRSGTHWLAHIMRNVFGPGNAAHEPENYHHIRDVVVDARLRYDLEAIEKAGHRVIHLVRDGRDVVRSLHEWYPRNNWQRRQFITGELITSYGGTYISFEECCHEWAHAIEMMGNHKIMRLEDITKPRDSQRAYSLPHWKEWDDDQTETFWDICGDQMRKMGYLP